MSWNFFNLKVELSWVVDAGEARINLMYIFYLKSLWGEISLIGFFYLNVGLSWVVDAGEASSLSDSICFTSPWPPPSPLPLLSSPSITITNTFTNAITNTITNTIIQIQLQKQIQFQYNPTVTIATTHHQLHQQLRWC